MPPDSFRVLQILKHPSYAGAYVWGRSRRDPTRRRRPGTAYAATVRVAAEHWPEQRIDLPRFWIDRTEVTNAAFAMLADMAALTGIEAPSYPDTPAMKPGPIDLPSVDPGGMVRSLAQAFVDNRKARKPLGALLAALPGDPAARVTALKTADSILRAAFTAR